MTTDPPARSHPDKAAADEARAPNPRARPNLAGCRVLVVEDEYFIAEDLRTTLERCGAAVVGPAPDLATGLALARREGAALTAAVVDINLHGQLAGHEIAGELNRLGVPFVYASGYEAESVPPALQGAAHFVKPVRIEDVVGAVGRLCRRDPHG